MSQQTDSELLREYIEKHSESAFAELVNRHIALVHSAALRIVVDPHLAQDVTQTTFTILAREARHLTGRALLSSWLHRTASNQAAKLVRGEMRRRAREQESYAMQTLPLESDAHPNDWRRIAPLLDTALNKLAEPDRSVILLRYFEKKSAKDIAVALEINEDAAQKRVNRALERLRAILVRPGLVLSTTSLAALVASQAVAAAPVGLATSVSATALAGAAAAGGITFSTFKLILMYKFKSCTLCALAIAGAATPIVLQHRTIHRLRSENFALQAQAQQAETAGNENARLFAQLSDPRRAAPTNADTSELLRLRGEVSRLRPLESEVARLRAESEQEKSEARKMMEQMAAAQQATLQFTTQRITSIDAMKQVAHQLRTLAAANNLEAAFTADGKLDPHLIDPKHPEFDLQNVEMAISDRSQLSQLFQEAPNTIVARTAEAIHTPDDRWMRFYIQADGSVQNYSTPFSNQVFSANWQLERHKP